MNYVYFIQSVHGGDIKIGVTDDLKARLRQLNTGSDEKLTIRGTLKYRTRKRMFEQEKYLHRKFAYLNTKLEWFSPGPELLLYMLFKGIFPAWTARTLFYCLKSAATLL